MNYYLMQQDSKSQEVPRIVNWFGIIPVGAMEPENYGKLPKITVLEINMAPNTCFKELVLSPFCLLPKEAGAILTAFEPWMEYKNIVLWSRTRQKNHKYLFPLLQKYDCLAEESVLNRDRTILEKGVLKKGAIPDKVMFMPDKVNSRLVIVREDFVEALLQNEYLGFVLTKLTVGE